MELKKLLKPRNLQQQWHAGHLPFTHRLMVTAFVKQALFFLLFLKQCLYWIFKSEKGQNLEHRSAGQQSEMWQCISTQVMIGGGRSMKQKYKYPKLDFLLSPHVITVTEASSFLLLEAVTNIQDRRWEQLRPSRRRWQNHHEWLNAKTHEGKFGYILNVASPKPGVDGARSEFHWDWKKKLNE